VAFQICGLLSRAVGFGHIDANGATRQTLDNFMQLEVLEREDTQVAIVASCDNPVLLAVLTDAEGHQVVNLSAVEPQDHVGVDLVHLVLVVTHDIIEAALRENSRLHGNAVAVLRVFHLLVNQSNAV